jgi:hypothetical protein
MAMLRTAISTTHSIKVDRIILLDHLSSARRSLDQLILRRARQLAGFARNSKLLQGLVGLFSNWGASEDKQVVKRSGTSLLTAYLILDT